MKFAVGKTHVVLRSWEDTDLERLLVIADNPNISSFLTDRFPNPYTRQAGENFIRFARAGGNHVIFAIEVDGLLSGGIGLHGLEDVFRYNAEMGYWLDESAWGKGIMTACVVHMVDWGFKNLDYTRIFARPFSNNPASKKVLEKAGFEFEALLKETVVKNDEVLDELIYAVRKSKS